MVSTSPAPAYLLFHSKCLFANCTLTVLFFKSFIEQRCCPPYVMKIILSTLFRCIVRAQTPSCSSGLSYAFLVYCFGFLVALTSTSYTMSYTCFWYNVSVLRSKLMPIFAMGSNLAVLVASCGLSFCVQLLPPE